MPAFKMSASRIFAGLAASAFFTPAFCIAATLVVNNETPLDIQTPPGFTYTVAVPGADGSLAVPTEGFLFCANVSDGGSNQTPVKVMPQHGDWRLPVAQDVLGVVYNGGVLQVNHQQTTLVCHSVGAQGETSSPLMEGVFRNSFDTKAFEQYPNLINWIAPLAFDWNTPNWSQVPPDPCSPSVDQPAQVNEDVVCSAASGIRPAGAGVTTRAATMWTGTDGLNFFYVARIDARYGVQNEADGADTRQLPVITSGEQPEGANSATLSVVDAYDRGVVGVGGGYLGDTGQWCLLMDVPNVLDGNLCVGALTAGVLNGPLNITQLPLHIGIPPLEVQRVSFYLAFIRPIIGSPPSIDEPAAAVSILLEPSVTLEGGDKFKGDDVVFGFLPTSQGFPWMHGQ